MAAEGLTPGGLHKQFTSKDDLLVQAEHAAIRTRSVMLAAPAADEPGTARETFLDTYLSAAHRDHPGDGCPTAALATDVTRGGAAPAVRARYTDGVREFVGTLAALDGNESSALVDVATLVGALLLARATKGDPLSDKFLTTARDSLSRSS